MRCVGGVLEPPVLLEQQPATGIGFQRWCSSSSSARPTPRRRLEAASTWYFRSITCAQFLLQTWSGDYPSNLKRPMGRCDAATAVMPWEPGRWVEESPSQGETLAASLIDAFSLTIDAIPDR